MLLTDVQDTAGEAAAKAIRLTGGQALYQHHDVSDEGAWEAAVGAAREHFGNLDILVNNAGVGGGLKPLHEQTLEDWRALMAVNLDGVFLGVKHGIRAMAEHGGSIINMSSVLGLVGMPLAGAYAASKGGVRLLTKAAALECAQRKPATRVNSIHPGFIDTPMVQRAAAHGLELQALTQFVQPTGEMGRPDDIADGVVYLASEESRFVTGSELVIDGGLTAR